MQDAIIGIMNNWGYLGVFLLIMLESIFPPVPSEIILVFGGALTASAFGGKLGIPGILILATIGSILGALVLYYIGKILKTERLKKIVSGKVGKVLRLKPADIDRADKWFDEKGNISVLICRCIPLLRSIISIPAGMSEMPLIKFVLYTTIGSTVWNVVLVMIGHNLGNNWESIMSFFDQFQYIVLGICLLIAIGLLIWWFGFFRKKKASSKAKLTTDSKVAKK